MNDKMVTKSSGGDCFDVCEGHPPTKVIDYENECFNDNHDPGCLCGYGRTEVPFREPLKAIQEQPDPYRPGSPNLLYFKEVEPYTRLDKLTHCWVLTDHKGVRIAESLGFYGFKEEAIANAIAIFGKEIVAGIHDIPNRDDYLLVLEMCVEGEVADMIRKISA